MLTIDIHKASSVADESFRSPEQVIEGNAEANLLYHLVGILGVDVVLYCDDALFLKVLWGNLDEIRNFCLDV